MTQQKKKEIQYFQGRKVRATDYKLCANCGEQLRCNHNGNYCNDLCLKQYLKSQNDIRIEKWTN